MTSKKSEKSQERKSDGNDKLPLTAKQDQALSPMACKYLELLPSETNIVAAAAMAPQAKKFEPGKLLDLVEKIREAEKIRVLDRRRSLAWEMGIEELETLLRHLGCFEPSQGVPLNDPIWQDSIVSPALHVYEELRQANHNPVEKDKARDVSLFLEMHEHKSNFKRPEFPCALVDALRYCSGIVGHPTAALKEAFKDLLTHSRWKCENAKSHNNSKEPRHPLEKSNSSCPLPTTSLSPEQIEEFEQDQHSVQGVRQLATLLKHFGSFWILAQKHYLAEHEAKDESKIKRVAALKKTGNTGVENRERDRWLKYAGAFTKQYGKIIREGDCDSLKSSSIIDDFTTEYPRKKGAPASDLVKALFQTILGAKDDLDVTPGIIKQRAIESLGKRNSPPFKALTDEAIHEVAEVLIMKTKTKRPTSAPRKRNRGGGANKTS